MQSGFKIQAGKSLKGLIKVSHSLAQNDAILKAFLEVIPNAAACYVLNPDAELLFFL